MWIPKWIAVHLHRGCSGLTLRSRVGPALSLSYYTPPLHAPPASAAFYKRLDSAFLPFLDSILWTLEFQILVSRSVCLCWIRCFTDYGSLERNCPYTLPNLNLGNPLQWALKDLQWNPKLCAIYGIEINIFLQLHFILSYHYGIEISCSSFSSLSLSALARSKR